MRQHLTEIHVNDKDGGLSCQQRESLPPGVVSITEYRGYTLTARDPYGFYRVTDENGKQVLEGQFTDKTEASVAIDTMLAETKRTKLEKLDNNKEGK